MKRILLFILLTLNVAVVMAEAIGSWKLYPCYNNVADIQPAGDKIYVLASGNLYSYNNHDTSLQEYNKTTGLSSSEITNIAWVQNVKVLAIVYSDCKIDLLYDNGDVTCINDYAEKTMTGTKTVNDIYVSGQYAYISTGFGIIKLDVKNEYVVDTYNLGYNVNYCYISGNRIYAASSTEGLMESDMTSNLLDKNNWTNVGEYTPKTKEQYVLDTHNNCYWAADADSKLTKYQKQDDGTFIAVSTGVKPDGPNTNYWWRLTINDGIIYCADGQYDVDTAGKENHPGNVKIWDGNSWSILQKDIVTEKCSYYNTACNTIVDPTDPNHVFVTAFSGLYEFKNKGFVKYYNRDDYAVSDSKYYHDILLTGSFDASGNLWLVSYYNKYISMLDKTGKWTVKNFEYVLSGLLNVSVQSMFFDSRNLLWFCSTRWTDSRIFCYNPATDVLKRYDTFINQDGTVYNDIFIRTLAVDIDGNIWIGTNEGPFYITASDIKDGNDIMTQHKINRYDGTNFADYLLSGVDVRCIAVDKANRKWMGTLNNGVYVISSDCNSQLLHFTSENSPLPSNGVTDIKIDKNTGIVYIVSSKGLCSYQSDVTSENEGLSRETVWAYPNPVTPEFTGMITICGLTVGSQLKITTSSGQLVHSGTCSGGSYQWNGKDSQGRKVASGIYMVNVSTSEGDKGCVTKIAIVM